MNTINGAGWIWTGLTLLVAAAAYGLGRNSQRTPHFTFSHRSDGIYRYDQISGNVHVLLPNNIDWQRIVTSDPTSKLNK
jgi:hypothetical protein